jgi:uncharacterized protein (TIGR04255 family)
VVGLPLLQLPYELREQEGFRFRATHQLENEHFIVQLGPQVVVIVAKLDPGYPGWELFRNEILAVVKAYHDADLIDSVLRLGLRYTNQFDRNVVEQLTTGIRSKQNYDIVDQSIQMLVRHGGVQNRITIGLQRSPEDKNPPGAATVIDIDSFDNRTQLADDWNFRESVESLHQAEKELFYSLLSDDLLNELNPVYT